MAAPTHDASSTGQQTATGTTLTIAHTVGATANYLKVSVGGNNVNPGPISGVTYNTVALTRLGSELTGPDANLSESFWYLVNPATGLHDCVITTVKGTDALAAVVSSYIGVNTGAPHGTPATNTGNTNAPTVNVTSAAGELVVDAVSAHDVTITACGKTQRGNVSDVGNNISTGAADAAGAGTVTMSWTLSGVTGWAITSVSLKPLSSSTIIDENEWNALEPQTNPLLISRW